MWIVRLPRTVRGERITLRILPMNSMRSFAVVVILGVLACSLPARAFQNKTNAAPRNSVEQALASFLTAFDNLDWPSFAACFSDDATVFHPALPNVRRTDSRKDFESAWLGVFARIRASSGRSSPPYMDLKPRDLRIQFLSPDVALVTFHLFDWPATGRRSVILKRFPDGWKIVHLHASNIDTPAGH